MLVIAVLAVVISLPTLGVDPMLDDLLHTFILRGNAVPGASGRIWDLYRFADGPGVSKAIDLGLYPWWTSSHLHLAFFRPLSSLWLAFDHLVLGNRIALAHLESCLLY